MHNECEEDEVFSFCLNSEGVQKTNIADYVVYCVSSILNIGT